MPATQTTPRILISRFPGTCTACHGRFDKGEPIIWHERGKATHEVCPSSKPAVLPIPPKPAVTASPAASKPATADIYIPQSTYRDIQWDNPAKAEKFILDQLQAQGIKLQETK